jgi:hypothetical protein
MRQYSQLFCLSLQMGISEMLQYYPELEVVELFRAEKYLSQDNGHYKLSNAQ